jgi:hypothetical protein
MTMREYLDINNNPLGNTMMGKSQTVFKATQSQLQLALCNLQSQLFAVVAQMLVLGLPTKDRHLLHHQRTFILAQIDEITEQLAIQYRATIQGTENPNPELAVTAWAVPKVLGPTPTNM